MRRSITLPDDLAAAVKAADLDVSEVCRRALEHELGAEDRELGAEDRELGAEDREQQREKLIEELAKVAVLVLVVALTTD